MVLEEKSILYLSISFLCRVLPLTPAVPCRSHPDKERCPKALSNASWDTWHHLLQNMSRVCNLTMITQQPNKLTRATQRSQAQISYLHSSDGIIARLHIQMSICLSVWYTDRAYALEAKFTPVVTSLTPVAITQRINLAHSVSQYIWFIISFL